MTIRRLVAVRLAAVIAASALVAGCQTARSFDQGCPGLYSGVRYYGSQIGDLPADGAMTVTGKVQKFVMREAMIEELGLAAQRTA